MKTENQIKYVINADDFGGYDAVNYAIDECFAKGLISQTTLMVTWECYGIAKYLAIEHGYFDRIGLHVSLTRGKSLTENIRKDKKLYYPNNFFSTYLFIKKHCFFFLSRKHKKLIKEEIDAQMAFYVKERYSLMHFDSHGHLHSFYSLYKIFIELGLKYHFRSVRIPLSTEKESFIAKILKNRVINAYRKNFIVVDTCSDIQYFITHEQSDSFEVMVHPNSNTLADYEEVAAKLLTSYGQPVSYSEIN